jgi:hypothetical protein
MNAIEAATAAADAKNAPDPFRAAAAGGLAISSTASGAGSGGGLADVPDSPSLGAATPLAALPLHSAALDASPARTTSRRPSAVEALFRAASAVVGGTPHHAHPSEGASADASPSGRSVAGSDSGGTVASSIISPAALSQWGSRVASTVAGVAVESSRVVAAVSSGVATETSRAVSAVAIGFGQGIGSVGQHIPAHGGAPLHPPTGSGGSGASSDGAPAHAASSGLPPVAPTASRSGSGSGGSGSGGGFARYFGFGGARKASVTGPSPLNPARGASGAGTPATPSTAASSAAAAVAEGGASALPAVVGTTAARAVPSPPPPAPSGSARTSPEGASKGRARSGSGSAPGGKSSGSPSGSFRGLLSRLGSSGPGAAGGGSGGGSGGGKGGAASGTSVSVSVLSSVRNAPASALGVKGSRETAAMLQQLKIPEGPVELFVEALFDTDCRAVGVTVDGVTAIRFAPPPGRPVLQVDATEGGEGSGGGGGGGAANEGGEGSEGDEIPTATLSDFALGKPVIASPAAGKRSRGGTNASRDNVPIGEGFPSCEGGAPMSPPLRIRAPSSGEAAEVAPPAASSEASAVEAVHAAAAVGAGAEAAAGAAGAPAAPPARPALLPPTTPGLNPAVALLLPIVRRTLRDSRDGLARLVMALDARRGEGSMLSRAAFEAAASGLLTALDVAEARSDFPRARALMAISQTF